MKVGVVILFKLKLQNVILNLLYKINLIFTTVIESLQISECLLFNSGSSRSTSPAIFVDDIRPSSSPLVSFNLIVDTTVVWISKEIVDDAYAGLVVLLSDLVGLNGRVEEVGMTSVAIRDTGIRSLN